MSRVVHLITGLGIGGAELALAQLLRAGGPGDEVICLKNLGPVASQIESAGTRCWSLGMERRRDFVRALPKLRRHLRQTRPQVLITWLYHANILGFFAAEKAHTAVVWNLRGSHADESGQTDGHDVIQRLSAHLSKRNLPKMIAVSESAKNAHIAYGYDAQKIEVIENGVDGDRFFFSEQRRNAMRALYKIPEDDLVIGHMGRFSLVKDHQTLFRAFTKARAHFSERLHLFCFGEGLKKNLERDAPVGVFLFDAVPEAEHIYPGFDVTVLSSKYEGFPNVLLEAMASENNVVTTDVGDAARIVHDPRFIVSASAPDQMADVLVDVLRQSRQERKKIGSQHRNRVLQKFSTDYMVARYWNLVNALAK